MTDTADTTDAIAIYEQMAADARHTPDLVYIDQYGQERPA